MSRKILKWVNFESDHSVSVELARVAPDPSTSLETEEVDTSESDDISEAEDSLAAAQQQVEMMLNQAQDQVAAWQQEARQAGWEAGYAEGRQAAETEISEALATVQSLAQAAVTAKDKFLNDNQNMIGQLAVAIAKKIIGKELVVNQRAISDIVGKAIETANVHGACCIRVNPQDYDILRPLWDAIPSMQHPDQKWQLVADKRVNRGGCLIEVSGGVIDAQLETQLNQVSTAFEALGSDNGTA
jgi:flagellar assembly protein FliH